MSTKAKLGKDWVKAQVMLQETGETFHLILAPGQTWRSVVAWIDGKMVTGRIELVPINNADPRGPDVTVQLRFPSLEAAAAAEAATPAAPVAVTPVAAPVEPPPSEPVAAPVAEAAPAAVAPAEDAPVTPENSDDTAVQEPAPSSEDPVIRPAGEGRRKRRG